MVHTFSATVAASNSWSIIRIPKAISQSLPSRGLAMARITIDGLQQNTALEPDGDGSHWLRVELEPGRHVNVTVEPITQWTEPEVPEDLALALKGDPAAEAVWHDITPMARWDWIRWIRSTNNTETRQKRIGVAFDKMHTGSRRPCCFNRSMCTEPSVSKNGVLVTA